MYATSVKPISLCEIITQNISSQEEETLTFHMEIPLTTYLAESNREEKLGDTKSDSMNYADRVKTFVIQR